VLPTPGHTLGSVSLIMDVDGKRTAFSGDLMHSPGKLVNLSVRATARGPSRVAWPCERPFVAARASPPPNAMSCGMSCASHKAGQRSGDQSSVSCSLASTSNSIPCASSSKRHRTR
jgi:hypothetical protein